MPLPEGAYTLSVIIFFAALGVLIWRDRKNIEFHWVFLMRRTKRFRELVDAVAQANPKLWRMAGNLGIVAALFAMVYGVWFLLTIARGILTGLISKPAMQLILPSAGASASSGPGYMLIPFWIWLAVIAMILVPHELMHGVMARAEKIRLKSVGLLLFLIFPGAFVEPDEKQLKRATLSTRLRVFAAGSFANFCTAAIALMLALFVFWPASVNTSIALNITSVNMSSPAEEAGLPAGALVTSINGKHLTASYREYLAGGSFASEELGKVEAGKPVVFTAGGADYTINPRVNPATDRVWIGFMGSFGNIESSETASFILSFLTLLWALGFAVGLVNILPLHPLDGGLFLEALAKRFVPRQARQLTRAATLIMLALLLFAFFGPGILGFV